VPEHELVALLDADGAREPRAVGQHKHGEDYIQTILVSVVQQHEQAHTAAQQRAFELLDEVVSEIETTPTLGVLEALGLQFFEAQVVSYRLEPRGPNDAGTREAALIVGVRCRSRI
jgi:hypothetical protein